MLLLQKDLIDLLGEISRIGTTLPLAILIVGVIGMGLANVTFADALISERHSAGIELIILIRENLCSGFVSEEKSDEKELFAEIKSFIFTKSMFTISLLYIDFFLSYQRNLLFQIISLMISP